MRNKNGVLVMALLSLGLSLAACQEDKVPAAWEERLTVEEETTLFHMREEEKLARDVYTVLGNRYPLPIFTNIAASEQRHVDFVLDVMDQYGIPDSGTDEAGVFTLPELQGLYRSLIAKGEKSLLDALIVGATIEDLDIRDLNQAILDTGHEDLINLYELLRCGSGNHLRGFYRQILAQGGDYTPAFISQDQFDAIINDSHQSCLR